MLVCFQFRTTLFVCSKQATEELWHLAYRLQWKTLSIIVVGLNAVVAKQSEIFYIFIFGVTLYLDSAKCIITLRMSER